MYRTLSFSSPCFYICSNNFYFLLLTSLPRSLVRLCYNISLSTILAPSFFFLFCHISTLPQLLLSLHTNFIYLFLYFTLYYYSHLTSLITLLSTPSMYLYFSRHFSFLYLLFLILFISRLAYHTSDVSLALLLTAHGQYVSHHY